eukprot:TRINITY_DN5130_c0_g1_i1.p1 TRINITY_DN5130_c0_g1~~TRINITY_DN5130_c0_g1_i1.p1  ORF type:complete len:137 (-),score=4.54 TRINITY_DN5130_c0_g1_i1:415-825(-)
MRCRKLINNNKNLSASFNSKDQPQFRNNPFLPFPRDISKTRIAVRKHSTIPLSQLTNSLRESSSTQHLPHPTFPPKGGELSAKKLEDSAKRLKPRAFKLTGAKNQLELSETKTCQSTVAKKAIKRIGRENSNVTSS